MGSHNRTIILIASKLGLNNNENVVSKAAEYERLLQTKSTAGSNLTDTSKVVICLDLAASFYNSSFDLKSAVKYSGLKPLAYTNCRRMVENILEINNEILTTAILCISLQCSQLQSLADRIIEECQKQAKMEVDITLPQYVCMAVFQACRINNVKVSKTKLVEKSRLKSAQWNKLEAEWTKMVDLKFAGEKKKRGKLSKVAVKDKVEEMEVVELKNNEDTTQDTVEPYEVWKKRMLENAYRELKEQQFSGKLDNGSLRRSPRKTPQKFSPYKQITNSPAKELKGVRLLFS